MRRDPSPGHARRLMQRRGRRVSSDGPGVSGAQRHEKHVLLPATGITPHALCTRQAHRVGSPGGEGKLRSLDTRQGMVSSDFYGAASAIYSMHGWLTGVRLHVGNGVDVIVRVAVVVRVAVAPGAVGVLATLGVLVAVPTSVAPSSRYSR